MACKESSSVAQTLCNFRYEVSSGRTVTKDPKRYSMTFKDYVYKKKKKLVKDKKNTETDQAVCLILSV